MFCELCYLTVSEQFEHKAVISRVQYLVLVGGVEGNLCHFGVSVSHITNTAAAQLDAFQQSRL